MNSKLFDAPQINSATIDHYLARGRQERARAFSEMIRGIFSSPAGRGADVHALPPRERTPAKARVQARTPSAGRARAA